MNICLAVSELLHAYGRTDRAILMPSQHEAKAPNNQTLIRQRGMKSEHETIP